MRINQHSALITVGEDFLLHSPSAHVGSVFAMSIARACNPKPLLPQKTADAGCCVVSAETISKYSYKSRGREDTEWGQGWWPRAR